MIAKPNAYQSPMQFLETWALSKLVHGNFYGLKFRDNRNVVTGIYPLNPWRVRPNPKSAVRIETEFPRPASARASARTLKTVPPFSSKG